MRHVIRHAPIVQAGIRALSKEEFEFLHNQKISCFFAHQLQQDARLWDEIVSCLDDLVYITIDLDVFDPAIMPAVGTPEPGGPGWYEVLALLRKVSGKCRIVGFDVMELLPMPQVVAPDFVAARLVYKLLSYIFMDNPHPY